MDYLALVVKICVLAFIQNVSFSITSRSRNRDSRSYHLIAAAFSNGIWFLTMRELVLTDMTLALAPWYIAATVLGSDHGRSVAIWIERKLGARADGHLPSTS